MIHRLEIMVAEDVVCFLFSLILRSSTPTRDRDGKLKTYSPPGLLPGRWHGGLDVDPSALLGGFLQRSYETGSRPSFP